MLFEFWFCRVLFALFFFSSYFLTFSTPGIFRGRRRGGCLVRWVMATVMKRAKELAVEDTVSETASRGWLPPSKLVSPLGGGGYSESEYSMLERDRGKYLLYAASINEAIYDISSRTKNLHWKQGITRMNVLVCGCGRGRLIQFVLDAVDRKHQSRLPIHIWALDANQDAVIHPAVPPPTITIF